jgi:phosphatidylglycerophosphate synthase
VRTVQSGPIIGLIVQVVLLAGLAGTVGLGVTGWLAGGVYGAVMCVLLSRGLRDSGTDRLSPADRVTLSRATLVGAVTALTADSFTRPTPVTLLVTLATVALALDAVDGYVARRTGTATALGARFDMEVDAYLLLVLSVYVMEPVGLWALAIGGMRYVFVVAIWVLPWMRGTLPPRYWRKVVAATQGIVLVLAAADLLPRPLTVTAVAVALALLVESFGRDVLWLWRHHSATPARTARPGPSVRLTPATRPGSGLRVNLPAHVVAVRGTGPLGIARTSVDRPYRFHDPVP